MSPDAGNRFPAQPRFPLNRVLALLGPYIAMLSGAITAWLSQHFPGLEDNLPATTEGITQGVTFVIGAAIAWALQHKYLDGWQQWEGGLLALETAQRAGAHGAGAPRREPSFDAERVFGDFGAGPEPAPARDGTSERQFAEHRSHGREPDERRFAQRPTPEPSAQQFDEPESFAEELSERPVDDPFANFDPALFEPGSGRPADG